MAVLSRERMETTKAFFEAFRVPAVIIVLALIFSFPSIILNFVDRAGFKVDAIEFAGVKAVAKKATENWEGTAAQLAQVTSALADRNKLLAEIGGRVADPDLRKRIAELTQTGNEVVQTGVATASTAAQQAAVEQERLRDLTSTTPSAVLQDDSLFVFGADPDVQSALTEVKKVQGQVAYSGATVALFKKGNFYRSAAVFSTKAGRDAAIKTIEQAVKRSGTPVSAMAWCPAAKRMDDAAAGVPLYQC